jgi:diaminopimelate epimerase
MIPFYKVQGTGNDFIAFDFRNSDFPIEKLKASAPFWCHRRTGVGADGILALYPTTLPNSDYTMVYLNADGSDAGMCGNGGRCIAFLASRLGIAPNHNFDIHHVLYKAEVLADQVILHFPVQATIQTISDEEFGNIDIINTGTEHICIQLDDMRHLDDMEFIRIHGKKLRFDNRFSPKGTNVNFYYPLSNDLIKLVTYERGVEDITLSCGTGSLAAAICHGTNTECASVLVRNRGGDLMCSFEHVPNDLSFNSLTLKGPATVVFEGKISA